MRIVTNSLVRETEVDDRSPPPSPQPSPASGGRGRIQLLSLLMAILPCSPSQAAGDTAPAPIDRAAAFAEAKRLIAAKDAPQKLSGARALDLWSEAAISQATPVSFKDDLPAWAAALGWCVDRQTRPAAAGGVQFRRILFRHSWHKELLAGLPVSDRKRWVEEMTALIHADTPVVEPFFLSTIWSLPSADRMEAVRRLGERLNRTSSRLLVALTLYTLVPQETIDAARKHLMIHTTGGKEIYRDLVSEINSLRVGGDMDVSRPRPPSDRDVGHPGGDDTEEALWLKDAIRIGLRSAADRERAAAMGRAVRLIESGRLPADLGPALVDGVTGVIDQKTLPLFGAAYRLMTSLYEAKACSFDLLRRHLKTALQYNPFDPERGGRYIDLRDSRYYWILYVGLAAREPVLPRADRLDLARSLMAVPVDERYEEDLREVMKSIVSAGLIGKAEYERWAEKRKIGE